MEGYYPADDSFGRDELYHYSVLGAKTAVGEFGF
jgi:hypothetical protein